MADKSIKDAEKALGGGVMAIGKGAKGFNQEFMEFLQKYQVIGLAVAFVIGAAATKLVNSTVSDIIMPLVGVLTPDGNWREAVFQVGPIKFLLGDFIGAIIDFLIIALVIFFTVKYVMKGDVSKKI
ncbi:MscL family protein [uncultured Methanoregula sp.]|uniref:MscL family protein n=1 Tax=uncultured Methanoregula sp. TaxID=1005933 RepID=UPI002AAB548E|nr:MscL family protein [uncultured Methanoregula sp.]